MSRAGNGVHSVYYTMLQHHSKIFWGNEDDGVISSVIGPGMYSVLH